MLIRIFIRSKNLNVKKTLLCWLAALGAAAVIPACGGAAGDKSLSGLDRERFRSEVNGRPTDLYTLTNAAGMEVCITNFGGRIVSVMVPDRTGTLRDVVLGFDNIADYVRIPSDFGASIGRYANRIGHGRFVLDGDTVRLPVNNYGHCLHGGPDGWQYRVYEAHQPDPQSLALTLHSPDGDAGFPGAVTAKVVYRLTEDNAIDITYEATADRPTVVNLTNHSYWNLADENAGSVLGHKLRLRASRWLPTDETLIPTGELAGVAGTPMDFRTSKPLGRDIRADFPALRYGKGYDNCWAVDDWRADEETTVAELYDPKSGRRLSVRSTQPGVQVYTGNWLAGSPLSKSGRPYADYDGVAIECQGFPDAPNRPDFPSAELRPGEAYRRTIRFRFDVR